MIEYYTFKHRGDAEEYKDEIFFRNSLPITIALFYGSKIESAPRSQGLLFSEILSSEEGSKGITEIEKVFEECLDEESEYLILRVLNKGIESTRRGDVCAKIVRNGQISLLPNGYFGLTDEDWIICATSNFYRYLTDEGILADALVSENCSDWMNLMIRRISDQTQLKCGNLSAIALKLRT